MKTIKGKLWSKLTKHENRNHKTHEPSSSSNRTTENKTAIFIIIAIMFWIVLFSTIIFILDEHAQISGATDNKVRLTLIQSLAGIVSAIVAIAVGYKCVIRKNK